MAAPCPAGRLRSSPGPRPPVEGPAKSPPRAPRITLCQIYVEGGFDPYSGLCKFLLTRILLRFYHDSRILRGNEDFPRPSLGLPREAPCLAIANSNFSSLIVSSVLLRLSDCLISPVVSCLLAQRCRASSVLLALFAQASAEHLFCVCYFDTNSCVASL